MAYLYQMKNRPNKHSFSQCLCLLAAFAILLGGAACKAHASDIEAGAAKVDITPAIGTPLSGYGKLRGKETIGIHDPIYARALAVSQGDQNIVFLGLDLCLVDQKLRTRIHEKLSLKHDLAASHLIVFATHTHSGSGAIGKRFWQKFIMGKFSDEVFETLTDRSAEAAVLAIDQLEPVTAEIGQINIDDLIENRMIPKLKYPQELKVIRLLNNDSKVISHLFSMAAHPTLHPAKDLVFSADYPGLLMSAYDENYPSSVSLFINGAAGDLRPHTPPHEDKLQRMYLYGDALIQRAEQIQYTSINLAGDWRIYHSTVKLPRVKVRAGRFTIPPLIGNRFFPRKVLFQGIRLGPIAFTTIPGELSSELGFEIKNRIKSAGLIPFIVGYANDYVGYIIPRRYYADREQYEARVTFYGEKFDLFIQRQSKEILENLLSTEELNHFNRPGILKMDNGLPVLNLKGGAYHLGYEEGRLLSEQIDQGLDQVFSYFRKELKVPIINRLIIYFVAKRAWNQLEPFLSYDELEQIRGIADGAGISHSKLKQIHAMPELFPTLCTNGAYWGDATKEDQLIAIRNLDWNREMRVFDLASVKYYDAGLNPDFVNIGYAGFSGVLSGMNDQGISVGQIGATSDDQSLKGLAMPFLLRRVLQESKDLKHAESVFRRSDLTQGYNYVIADAIEQEAIVMEATHQHLKLFKDYDPKELDVDYALPIKHAVFRGDPALDPVIRNLQWASKGKPDKPGLEPPGGSAYHIRYVKHGSLVQENYGKIDEVIAKSIAEQIAPKSNIQSVVYYYPFFEIANAEIDKRAVDSPYHKFHMDELKNLAA